MDMSDKPHNRDSDEDAVLNELIRACREKEPTDEFVRPDEDAITAYLLGAATEEQERAVTSALARSKEFRREILEMAQDMETLTELDLSTYEKEAAQIPVPEGIISGPTPESFWVKIKEFWARLMALRIPQVYAPAVAAAAVLALVIIQIVTVTTWSLVSENIDPGLLVSNITRATESKKVYSTPDLAALAEIRFLLNFESGQFYLNPPEERPEPPSPSRRVLLRLLDSNDSIIQEFMAHVPINKVGAVGRVTAWALGLPSRNLYKVKMRSETMEMKWTEDMGNYGCITFTYRDDEGYRAVVGFTFDLR